MKNFTITILLCLTTSPLAAQTACPTAADLGRGIRFDFSDGSHEIYRNRGPGVTAVTGFNANGSSYEMELGQGTHLLMYQSVSNGMADAASRITYDYGLQVGAMPVPVPGSGWSAPVTATASEGPRSEPQKQSYGALTTISIGDCTYDMIPVTIAYSTSDHYVEGIEYLPGLGVGYLVWNETDAAPRVPVPATRISVLTK